MIKKLYTALYADDDLLFLVKILVKSHFVVMKWAFVSVILIISILVMLIMRKMILILLFFSDCWLGIVNLKNLKHIKKN